MRLSVRCQPILPVPKQANYAHNPITQRTSLTILDFSQSFDAMMSSLKQANDDQHRVTKSMIDGISSNPTHKMRGDAGKSTV
jgi:hypothetical protein